MLQVKPTDTCKKNQGIYYYSKSCKKGVVKILTAMFRMQKRQDKMDRDVLEITHEVEQILKP